MKSEILKQIDGYPEYWVSSIGNVYSTKWGRLKRLKQSKTHNGYFRITLLKNGFLKTFYVHKLVAETFLPNPQNLPEVNHKDENKGNNSVDNLEWCDRKYNCNYGTRNKRIGINRTIKINQYTKEGIFIKTWDSIRCIGKVLGYDCSNISKCCLNKQKTAYGYRWSYTKV